MAKDLRQHNVHTEKSQLLHNFVIEKVEKNISLQIFRDLKTLFQNCFKSTVN
jgi:hypothetical protein